MTASFAPPEGYRAYGQPGGFLHELGPVYVAHRAGGEIVMLPTEARHANGAGSVSGGVVMTLLDIAMGVAVSAACGTEVPCPSMQINANFVSAGKVGQVLVASAEIQRVTSAVAFASATLTCGAEVVGTATGVFRIPPAISAEMAARRKAGAATPPQGERA
jgi:uncharacterized protein (TIGR00369 family)